MTVPLWRALQLKRSFLEGSYFKLDSLTSHLVPPHPHYIMLPFIAAQLYGGGASCTTLLHSHHYAHWHIHWVPCQQLGGW